MAFNKIQTLEAQISGIKDGDRAQKAQIADLASLIKDMNEEKNKTVKSVDSDNIAKVTEKMKGNTAAPQQKFIMDALAKILTGNGEATFDSAFDDLFVDA